jgi:hypothetical protein
MTVYLKIGRAKIIHSLLLFHRLIRFAKFDFAKLGANMGSRGRVGNVRPQPPGSELPGPWRKSAKADWGT